MESLNRKACRLNRDHQGGQDQYQLMSTYTLTRPHDPRTAWPVHASPGCSVKHRKPILHNLGTHPDRLVLHICHGLTRTGESLSIDVTLQLAVGDHFHSHLGVWIRLYR